ncbi:hypothetical protein Tsubulata_013395 [Turnera subulata]|uniref:GS catalytic domain-containing protein n=1 Tax=Turnera subulata TaxID=218843 RepID=A0A9Q0J3C6_9ROSI|nr:hypothetical protein Tsubulata_013395 [Turnera subulata]
MEEFAELREAIEKVELVDGHCHNIGALDSALVFVRAFTEATGGDALSHAPHSLSFKRNVREIAELYGSGNSLQAVEEYRKCWGLERITAACFKAAGISAILIDDGLRLDKKQSIDWHKLFAPFVGRILRIETLAEEILDSEREAGFTWTLDKFTQAFVTNLKSYPFSYSGVAEEIVGLKSIAAYRSGLEINTHVHRQDAEEGLSKFDLPMQIHTGFGDKDLDLRLANPLCLRFLLEDERFSKCRLVLLHASYPFSKEASYLASVYPQVMFSTDGYAFPETYYLGAKKARQCIFSVLRDTCVDGDLTVAEAIEAATDILAKNAINFYKINVVAKSSKNLAPVNSSVIEKTALENAVSLIRMIWIDASGQHRCRVVPAKRFHDVTVKDGVGLTFACMAMSSMQHEEMVLADMHIRPGEAWEYCPREALRRVLKVLKDEFDLVLDTGFESEFLLLKSVSRDGKEDWVPIDSAPYCSTSGYDAVAPLLHEIFSSLQSLNIKVEQLHAESGNGQFELAMGHTICIDAADDLIFTREIIRATARKHGLLATFVPKFALDDIGSGSHVHVSLLQNGKNVFMASGGSSQYGMSTIGEQFMAGVLEHLPSILAFTAPIPNSYDRLQPNTWSGAYLCWGKENREAPIRTACPPGINDGSVSNFEIKLPQSLSESLEALEKDKALTDLLGEKLLVAIKGVRKFVSC